MSETAAVDIDHLKGWEGREEFREELIADFPARAMASMLEWESVPVGGDPLPETWHWFYFLEAVGPSKTAADGHMKRGGFLPPVPLPRRMWAEVEINFLSPLIIGERARSESRITSVTAKEGRSGLLVFVTFERKILQSGAVCIEETQTLVFRDMPSAPSPLPAAEPLAEACQWTEQLTPDPVMLFRYSALTYNSHRIHYDRPYAVDYEHYPALVVHGPLQAALLVNSARHNLPGESLRSVHFRAMRPLFDNQAFTIQGRREENGARLWTVDHEGAPCMRVEVSLA